MKCKVVVIRIPLYNYNEEDQAIAMNDAEVEEVLGFIKGRDDVAGYSIDSVEVVEEDIDVEIEKDEEIEDDE